MTDKASMNKAKRPRDANQLAKAIVDIATVEDAPDVSAREVCKKEKDPAAVRLGRRGGLKGGKARAKALTSEERSKIASKAARSRWGRDRDDK